MGALNLAFWGAKVIQPFDNNRRFF